MLRRHRRVLRLVALLAVAALPSCRSQKSAATSVETSVPAQASAEATSASVSADCAWQAWAAACDSVEVVIRVDSISIAGATAYGAQAAIRAASPRAAARSASAAMRADSAWQASAASLAAESNAETEERTDRRPAMPVGRLLAIALLSAIAAYLIVKRPLKAD